MNGEGAAFFDYDNDGFEDIYLVTGAYHARLYSPMTGEYGNSIQMRGGGRVMVDLTPFKHDIILRVSRISGA